MEHTPGPWHVDGVAICDKDGRHIARVYMPEGMTIEEHEANAKLIAAAPQIFKMMQNLAQSMGMKVCVDDCM